MRVNLHERPGVTLSSIRGIIPHGKQRNTCRNNNRPVHLRRTLYLRRSRPEAKEDQQAKIAACYHIIGHPQFALEPPRTPRQTAVVRFVRGGVEEGIGAVVGIEVASKSTPEE